MATAQARTTKVIPVMLIPVMSLELQDGSQ